MKRSVTQFSLALTLFMCLLVTPAFAAKLIKIGHATPESDSMHIAWTFFKEEVEKRSNGQLKVEIFPNAALGNDRELSESVQFGEVTCASVSTSPLASFVSDLFILDVPFVFSERSDVWAALDGELGKALDKEMEKSGLVNLGYWENGFRNITNNARPIHVAADLKGIKLRTMENPIHMASWRALGANPTPMSFGEVFTALQQGTVDGQENPYALTFNSKFFEVSKYISNTRHIFTPYVPFINKGFLNGLPNDQREMILEVGREMAQYQRQVAEKLDEEARIAIESSDIKVTNLTPEERLTFRVAIEPALKLAEKRVSPATVKIFKETVLKQ